MAKSSAQRQSYISVLDTTFKFSRFGHQSFLAALIIKQNCNSKFPFY